jgi:hypothetical protein
MVYGDSLVVISQTNKDWDCSTDSMGKYCAAVRKLENKFEGLEFHHMERDRNAAAVALSKIGIQTGPGSTWDLRPRNITTKHPLGSGGRVQRLEPARVGP